MRIINLTPHEVIILEGDNRPIRRYPSRGVIRLSEKRELITKIDGIPVYYKAFTPDADLPPQRPNTYYIVSLPVAQAFPERSDFVIPDQLVRDDKGRIIGARAFARVRK